MKKLSLYIFLFLLTLTTISKAEVFIKCDHISGSLDKKIISQLKYIQFSNTLSDKKYWQNGEWRYYKILTFSGNTFQCNKINKSDLPIIEVKQKF